MVIDKYPTPRSEVLFSSLAGEKFVTKLDMAAAYNQLELDDESKEITKINTPKDFFNSTGNASVLIIPQAFSSFLCTSC